MATIRTAFALTDQMTRPIQHINSAMGILINSMESMSHTMGTNLDTSALEEARNHIADATAAFDQLEDEIMLFRISKNFRGSPTGNNLNLI